MITAYLNHGRWVVDCPMLGCGGARRLDHCRAGMFRCNECGAAAPVNVPADRPTVDRLVATRPPVHRNWHPGEPLAQLVRENLEHGIMEVAL